MKPLRNHKGIAYAVMSSSVDRELFFCKLGRFFCSLKITEEMGGYQIVDDPYRIWIVAFEADSKHRAVGFCSFSTETAEKKTIKLCDSYVDPDFRKRGVYGQMFELREKEYLQYLPHGGKIKGIALSISEKMFLDHGYHKASQRGRFAYMEKKIVVEEVSA